MDGHSSCIFTQVIKKKWKGGAAEAELLRAGTGMSRSQKKLFHAASLRVFATCFCQGPESAQTGCDGPGAAPAFILLTDCACLFPALHCGPVQPSQGSARPWCPVLGPDPPVQTHVPVPGRWHLPGAGAGRIWGKDPACPKPLSCPPVGVWQ